ncbi:uncharacterized protein BJ171DRAFT_569024 [Polychytrium aggregatum]|uniref:uncharacterized protein n=1 Tax=Polychytrium aggregatum TaxID=110093 RepID=UPI0022FF0821|nr:uncharacterized protein BJ171DRAFT_569024 [Polychytrium aggregatum]KAI9203311.1 hypothetical protein BJ171DRAFT_569024 [Polychytrium aggregatum]
MATFRSSPGYSESDDVSDTDFGSLPIKSEYPDAAYSSAMHSDHSPNGSPKKRKRSGLSSEERIEHRKIAHTAVERRRREKIQQKILELRDLVPTCTTHRNIQKAVILECTVDYIHELHAKIWDLSRRLQEASPAAATAAAAAGAAAPEYRLAHQSVYSAPIPPHPQASHSAPQPAPPASRDKLLRRNTTHIQDQAQVHTIPSIPSIPNSRILLNRILSLVHPVPAHALANRHGLGASFDPPTMLSRGVRPSAMSPDSVSVSVSASVSASAPSQAFNLTVPQSNPSDRVTPPSDAPGRSDGLTDSANRSMSIRSLLLG